MHFTHSDIVNNVGAAIHARGTEYARRGRVASIKQYGAVIDGSVKGSGRKLFLQEIDVLDEDGVIDIEGNCSCPVGFNCKHVAAVLVEYLRTSQFPVEEIYAAESENLTPQAALPYLMEDWLQRFERSLESAKQKQAGAPAKHKKLPIYRLIFVLAPEHVGGQPRLSVCKARLRADGEIGGAEPLRDSQRLLVSAPAYLVPGDEDLLRMFGVLQSSAYAYESHVIPKGKQGARLLRTLLDQNQLLWANSVAEMCKGQISPLRPAPLRHAGLAWRAIGKSLQLGWQFQLEPAPATTAATVAAESRIDTVLATDPPWYVDAHCCGELRLLPERDMDETLTLLNMVAQMPPLASGDALAVSQQLLARGLAQLIPVPSTPQDIKLDEVEIDIILYLGSIAPRAAGDTGWRDYAMLVFSYDGEEIRIDQPTAPQQAIVRQGQHAIEKIVRDPDAEHKAMQRLSDFGLRPAPADEAALLSMAGALVLPNLNDWLQFAEDALPALEAHGWHIKKTNSYRFDVVEVEDWYAEVADGADQAAGNAWFDLELGIVVNQARISLLPVLVELIRSAPHDFNREALARHADSDPLLARLPGGASVALPWGRVKPILATLGELYFTEKGGTSMRLSALDAARLSELADAAQLRWLGGERLRNLGSKLREFGGVRQVAAPAGLCGTLRDYQSEGLAWMQFLREYELAGILADDMGLGKTVQALAHILVEKEAGRLTQPALVVAPTSLMSNWQDEAARFAPGLKVLLLHGIERISRFEQIGQADLVLTSYALLYRDEDVLRKHGFHLVILDEAHYIKNARSKAAQTAGLLRARHRLCLTGTPLENHLGELWSQFHFLLPGLLAEEKAFNRDFRAPIEKQGDDLRRALLTRRIKPFLLRRTKDNVAKELPPKTEMVRTVELAGGQRDLYETVRLAMDKKVRDEIARKGVARSHIVILEALLKLRQVCCDPRLVKSDNSKKLAAGSAKLVDLLEMVEELLEEGRKILIFSQFTSMLALIEPELKQRGIAYALLTGDTQDRAAAVRSFQSGAVPIFLVSLKAGGVGLNLTAADTVIHYDPWWNPAAENQATDRAWRIGQDKPVFVYKLIAKGTVEEKIQVLQQKKADLARAILSDGAPQDFNITQDDLQAIFAPLEG